MCFFLRKESSQVYCVLFHKLLRSFPSRLFSNSHPFKTSVVKMRVYNFFPKDKGQFLLISFLLTISIFLPHEFKKTKQNVDAGTSRSF